MIRIPLTRGYVALVDDEDAQLATLKWHAAVSKRSNVVYARRAVRVNGRQTFIYLHHAVLGVKGVDHRDGDGLNCRRGNLRRATGTQNLGNTPVRKDNSSGFKGVCWDKNKRRWLAKVQIGGRQINLGRFATAEAAARAYDAAARRHFGEFARPNHSEDPR